MSINDLPKITDVLCIFFEDDIFLRLKCLNGNNLSELVETFNTISLWLSDHNLEKNNKKTQLIQLKPH